jgi:hypothetical protein
MAINIGNSSLGFPDTQGFAYAFERGECRAGNRSFSAISNVSIDQPTEEDAVMGTRSYPLLRTPGSMKLGEGKMTFSDEGERQAFLDSLGDNYREQIFQVIWTKTAPGKPAIKLVCFGCRCLSEPNDDSPGALSGDVNFSFMYYTRNGKVPHSGLPSPSR